MTLMVPKRPEWIVGTGATNHMASSLNLLDKASIVESSYPQRVHQPNGDVTLVSLHMKGVLYHVFYEPKF